MCWRIGHVHVQSCLLIIFRYQPISLQCSWLTIGFRMSEALLGIYNTIEDNSNAIMPYWADFYYWTLTSVFTKTLLAFTTRQDTENPFFMNIISHLTGVWILPVAEKLPSSCLQATVASLVSNPGAATRYVEPPKPSTSAAIDRKEPISGLLIVKVVELKFPPMRIIIAYHCYMKQYHQITFADKPECNFM